MSAVHSPGDRASVLDSLCELIPCRRTQIDTLLTLCGQNDHLSVPAMFLYGHSATGKSLISHSTMNYLQASHVVVNCIECYTSRLLYEQILNGLTDTVPSPANNFTSYSRCDNMNDFVRLLKQVARERKTEKQTTYLIFENAERLRDMEITLLPALLRLQELTGLNLTVLLESEIVWEKYYSGTGSIEPYKLFFPDYSKDELMDILSLDYPKDYPEDLYRNYLGLLLSVFHHASGSLTELRHLADLNFSKYVEPIKKGEATVKDMRKLWRNVEPHLKKALHTVYLREVSSTQWERMQKENIEQGTAMSVHGSSRTDLELPFYSKYLLIASYLASYNPAKSDKRFFTKHSGKINKRIQLAAQKRQNQERTSAQLLGPKPFPLDRLMAIFYSIVEGKVAPTANIFSQVRSLVSLRLLSPVTGNDSLEAPKYKCLVSLDFIKGVSRTVRFEIIRYLYDFV